MSRQLWIGCFCAAISASAMFVAEPSHAGTIIKLGLGGDVAADIKFDATTMTLETIDDLVPGTTGEQDTTVDFQGIFSGMADIMTPPGSFTLSGLTAAGLASVFPVPPASPVLVIQDFTGGTFELYNAANVLLLSGQLNNSTLTGPLGPPATGALFTTSFADITGGVLDSLNMLDRDSLTMSMSFTSISNGAGFRLQPTGAIRLDSFTADVTLNIAADVIPEPAALCLLMLGAATATGSMRRRRG